MYSSHVYFISFVVWLEVTIELRIRIKSTQFLYAMVQNLVIFFSHQLKSFKYPIFKRFPSIEMYTIFLKHVPAKHFQHVFTVIWTISICEHGVHRYFMPNHDVFRTLTRLFLGCAQYCDERNFVKTC